MVHRVLWTGGWDSTFRVLELVLHWKVSVEPHYVIFHPSAPQEMAAMDAIRQALGSDAERILPTRAV